MADLDQDGWPDIIVNEHGFGVRLLWNNHGEISAPYDLLMGDSHGVSVADMEGDGTLEVIVARGGGSGKNARNAVIFTVDRQRHVRRLEDFPDPLIAMRGRTVKFIDLNGDGAPDLLNFAFPSREKRGESENYLYRNTTAGELVLAGTLEAKVRGDGQQTLITDYDGDGQLDLLLYGNGPIALYRGDGEFGFVPAASGTLPQTYEYITSALEFDFDNDGDFDLYLSRGVPFESGQTFYDEESETWGFYVRREDFQYDLQSGEVLRLVNYQSPWPHRQVHVGESAYPYPFPGETHSGKTIDFVNSDSLGWPDKLQEQGLHVGYIGNNTWRIGGKIWSPTSGVLRNVTAPPPAEAVADRGDVAGMLLENRNGTFVDVSELAGLNEPMNIAAATAADLDNDGDEDLVLLPRGNLVSRMEAVFFLNDGRGAFSRLNGHRIGAFDPGSWGLGIEHLDYNRDGKMDLLFGNERGKWHLFTNTSQGKARTLTLQVGSRRIPGGATILDSVVRIEACGKQQLRRVGSSGAGYERSLDASVHFGLGACLGPVNVQIRWSDGGTTAKTLKVNEGLQFYSLED